MTLTEKQKVQLKDLHSKLWNICCDFWGKMEPEDYKDYVLGLLFYRYLSERTEKVIANLFEEDDITYEEAWKDEEIRASLTEDLLEMIGFVIEPKYLFSKMYKMINVEKEGFDIEYLQKAINAIMESTMGQESQEAFDGIFEDMDLNSSKLGKSVLDRSKLIAKAVTSIGSIDFVFDDAEIDILGDTYEYLIGQFASTAGKKSGSFYTPAAVGDLMARICTYDRPNILNALDMCGGSGSLLLALKRHSDVRNLYYQELTTAIYNLARMNFLLHNISYHNFNMTNDDSLEHPAYLDVAQDVIVANPPYSQKWSADKSFESDDRFNKYGVLAPKSKADYAFLLTMFHSLKHDGIMAIVLPHGVLFRGGTEEKIRQTLIKNNNIDTVIGLPPNCFFGTSIPTCIMILKKDKVNKDILFIDASKEYEAGKNKNYIREEDIEKIFNAYVNREDIEKFSHVAEIEEIEENDYNLNIPRYVDTFEEEEEIDIEEVQRKIIDLEEDKMKIKKELNEFFKELGLGEI